ncbi:hypothetical protein H6P81_017400 [Aristolochia fimbriata]|uniref:F-box/LRR-repeat protein 15/At3g58940/PEG3-like LRR domain-containing protein n=1 Tax=Aristolochia fimbriata TaxID=158543 RepID=A0AAV7DZF5_ARIFI|nr:hypothetical protein H6P81_017400 [Aristolochia fimbriata]
MGLRIPSALGQLRTLELVSVNLPAESFSLDSFSNCPALETLKFKSCCFKDWPSLCISAPSLKIIVFNDCKWNDCFIKVSALSLQKLDIDSCECDDCDIVVSAPRLKSFCYIFNSLPNSFVFRKVYCLESAVISCSTNDLDDDDALTLRKMFNSISYMDKLNLDLVSIKLLKHLVPLGLLKHLTLQLYHCFCDYYVNSVIKFLNDNFKIEILEISGFKEIDFLHGKNCCSQIKRPKKLTPLIHLKKLVVTYHVRDRKEIEWVKLLESNAPNLDEVTFNWEKDDGEKEEEEEEEEEEEDEDEDEDEEEDEEEDE